MAVATIANADIYKAIIGWAPRAEQLECWAFFIKATTGVITPFQVIYAIGRA